MVEFNRAVQQACDARNINTNQLVALIGRIKNRRSLGEAIRNERRQMGYALSFDDRTSGSANVIYSNWIHGSFRGGSCNTVDDYWIGW